MKRAIALFLSALLLLGLFTACANKGGASENVLRIATNDEPNTADAQKTTEYYFLPLNIFDTLLEVSVQEDGQTELTPSLAESWEVSPDGITYTFHLREGVKFHNGEVFKADDVVYTFERMLKPETEALNVDFLACIQGAQEMMDGNAQTLSGLEVKDDYTLVVTLEEPFAPFLAGLSTPACSIYNRKATEEAGDQFGIDPELTIGTGPFIFESWVVNSDKTLVANEEYWRGRPALDGITMTVVEDADTLKMLFESGELDIFDLEMAPVQAESYLESEEYKDQIVTGQRVGIYYMSINEALEPFQDVRVRKAYQMAIDKQEILDTVFAGMGEVQSGILPPGLIGHNPDLEEIEYNPEEAKRLLAEAGYPNGFEMEIAANADDTNTTTQVYEMVQAMLDEVGIDAEIVMYDDATWRAKRAEGQIGSYLSSWSADFNDPDNFIYSIFAPGNSERRSFNYSNEEVKQQIVEARGIVNEEERIALYQELEKQIVQEDAAWVPLFSKEHSFVVSERVEGFQVAWNGWAVTKYYDVSIKES